MDDEAIATFVSFTGQSEEVARRYLRLTDDVEQAISLFFESPDLGSNEPASNSQNAAGAARPAQQGTTPGGGASEPIEITSDDDEVMSDNAGATAAALGRAADYDDDEAMARRIQEEMYSGAEAGAGQDADAIRAPIAPTRETLVGGADDFYQGPEAHTTMLRQLQERSRPRTGAGGIFNQRMPSIWDDDADENTRSRRLAEATAGASNTSSKARQLGDAFRPPFELMSRLSWDDARDLGKADGKWIMVNVQNNAIFDCQTLNRDLWKHAGVKECIRENFIFFQYAHDDPAASQYLQYYLPQVDNDASYPHIAIIDPRTGEQVKVWSGPPNPDPGEFHMQLFEFLDRYSLDVTKKNPVAKRKPEKSASVDVGRLTEEEQLELALKASMGAEVANNGDRSDSDPDSLTKSIGNVKAEDTGATSTATAAAEEVEDLHDASQDPRFEEISSSQPHTEPGPGPDTTRIQFKHANGRPIVRRFAVADPVRRIYEWLKAETIEGYSAGAHFDLRSMGKDLIESLDETIEEAKLKNSVVMVEYTTE